MALDAAKNTLHGWYKSTVEYVTPVNEKSEYTEKGVLTPEEFIKAGCQLVYKCPTWSWESGDAKKRKQYLPDNQQYLISRNLPCLKRVKSLMNATANNESVVENGEWLNMENDEHSDNKDNLDNVTQEIADVDLDNIDSKPSAEESNANQQDSNTDNKPLIQIQDDYVAQNEPADGGNADEDDEDFVEIPDMEDYDDQDNVVSTSNAATTQKATATKQAQAEQPKSSSQATQQSNVDENENEKKEMFRVKENVDSSILKTRTYDISITYDKYYRVPRVWLRGYDENGTPLTSSEIFEDISADHAHKTVTVEPHPHSGVVCASIHPCRHSEVMKRFMTKFEESGKQITVDGYLFLFLKFMSAVIPTIQYDFTQSVDSK